MRRRLTSGSTTGQITLNTLGNLNATNFSVTIPAATANFLMSDSSSKLIQQPQIRASDGQKASLKIGERVPVATGIVPARHRRRRHQPAGQHAVQLHRRRREHRHHAARARPGRDHAEAGDGHLGRRLVSEHRRHSAAGHRTAQDRKRDPHEGRRGQHPGRHSGKHSRPSRCPAFPGWRRSRCSSICSPKNKKKSRTTRSSSS